MAKKVNTTVNVRIIDHKKVWMTSDEFRLYEEICKAYDRPNFKGTDLFQDHFEVNDDGVIVIVKPPHKRYSSMEVFTFLVSLQINQQLRLAQDQVHSLVKEAEENFQEKLQEIDVLKKELETLKGKVERPKENGLKAKQTKRRKNDGRTESE